MLPLGEGSEVEAREVHETSMVLSDAVIIFYGTASEHWVRMKLFDIVKAPGWGRRVPFRAAAVWVAEPTTPHKPAYDDRRGDGPRWDRRRRVAVLEPFLAQLARTATGR